MGKYKIDWFLSGVVTTNTVVIGMILLQHAASNLSTFKSFLISIITTMFYNLGVMMIVYISNKLLADKNLLDNTTLITGTIIYRHKNY